MLLSQSSVVPLPDLGTFVAGAASAAPLSEQRQRGPSREPFLFLTNVRQRKRVRELAA
jgi:hypothetical protein